MLYPTTPQAKAPSHLEARLTGIAAVVAILPFYVRDRQPKAPYIGDQNGKLTVRQLLCPQRRPLHRLDQRHPQTALF